VKNPEDVLREKIILLEEMAATVGKKLVDIEPTALGPKLVPPKDWILPLDSAAFYGLAGEFINCVLPETESDPAGLLINFLVLAGVKFGRDRWAFADGKRHYPVQYGLLVGKTGSGRKGSATARTMPAMEIGDPNYKDKVIGGLSSGEGLIKACMPLDPDVPDPFPRSYVAFLPEFSALLSVMRREGNTMGAMLREAWDGGRLQTRTVKPLVADNVNLSVIAHITPEEFINGLAQTDKANGFINRFLIALVRRSKLLPSGGSEIDYLGIAEKLRAAVQFASDNRGPVPFDQEAMRLWFDKYSELTRERDGIVGALCGRAEAHCVRLALLYAVLDSAKEIRVEHLRAAFAVWDYCERSMVKIFGEVSGDPAGDKILSVLAYGPKSIRDLLRAFSNNVKSEWLRIKLSQMVEKGRLRPVTIKAERGGEIEGWERVV
jgi:hypothetical protein